MTNQERNFFQFTFKAGQTSFAADVSRKRGSIVPERQTRELTSLQSQKFRAFSCHARTDLEVGELSVAHRSQNFEHDVELSGDSGRSCETTTTFFFIVVVRFHFQLTPSVSGHARRVRRDTTHIIHRRFSRRSPLNTTMQTAASTQWGHGGHVPPLL